MFLCQCCIQHRPNTRKMYYNKCYLRNCTHESTRWRFFPTSENWFIYTKQLNKWSLNMYIELIKVYRGDKDMQRNNPFTSSKQHDIAGDTIRSAFSLCGFFLSRNSSHQVENNIQSMVVERYTIFFLCRK